MFDKEKYEYCLAVHGPLFTMPDAKLEGLKAGKHYFNDVRELWYFFAELQILAHKLKAPPPMYTVREGRSVRYRTVATLTYLHNFITYQVDVTVDPITDHKELKQRLSAPDCGYGCDCVRSILIRAVSPDFPQLDHGDTIELLTVKIEDKK